MQNPTAVTIERPREVERVPKIDRNVSLVAITEQLQRDERLVITDNNQPVAIILKVDDSTLTETLLDLNRLQAERVLKEIHAASVKNGTSEMTMEEIDAEIAAARADRKNRGKSR